MISDKLLFPFLVERSAFLSDTIMDEHRGQELAELQKCQYAAELTTSESRCFVRIFSDCYINYLREILLSAECKKFDKIIIYLYIHLFSLKVNGKSIKRRAKVV